MRFIELTHDHNDGLAYINIDAITYIRDREDGKSGADVFIANSYETYMCVEDTCAEILAKIAEAEK